MDPAQPVGELQLIATALPLQEVAGYSQTMLLGLIAVLVLPAVTILFVGHLVRNQTIDEERVRRLESEVAQLREEVGASEENPGAE